jgi:hypothetical protein
MPSLIDCHSLRVLRIANNCNLVSLARASLETCTSLVELTINENGDWNQSNNPLSSTLYPNLKKLHVSLFSFFFIFVN